MAGLGSVPSVKEVVGWMRAVNNASEDDLQNFVESLDVNNIRYMVASFLKQFLPHYQAKKQRCISIDRVHNLRRSNVLKNKNDSCILFMVKQCVGDKYWNSISRRNPLSPNTDARARNKCGLIKLLSKNVLSQIISFVSNKDRCKNCASVCYPFYQACCESNAKITLDLTNCQIAKQINSNELSLEELRGFSNIIMPTYGNSHVMNKISNSFGVLSKCVKHMTLHCGMSNENHLHKFVHDKASVDKAKLSSICFNHASYAVMKEWLPTLENVQKIGIQHPQSGSISRMYKLLYSAGMHDKLKCLDLDLSGNEKWNVENHVIHHIHHFINLNELKLKLCFPSEDSGIKALVTTMETDKARENAIRYLTNLDIKWYFAKTGYVYVHQHKPILSANDFGRIMTDLTKYLSFLANNIDTIKFLSPVVNGS